MFCRSRHSRLISNDVCWRAITNFGKVFDLSGDLRFFAELCKDDCGLADAIGMLTALADGNDRTSGFEKAVYVIAVGDDPISKIGISANPLKRVEDLQGAHYRELRLHAVIFCPGRKAMTIEQDVLARAASDGSRLMGEWIAEAPDNVLAAAIESARRNKLDICDALTWRDNMIARTKELYRRQRARSRMTRKQRLALVAG